jgi:magnesium chelatase subunit I
MAINYPFSAIAGQDDMRRALMIAAIDPGIGGVMVFGDRGTGKSTAVRALADLLPPDGDTAVPVVDLPLGATEDRVVGALDLERALVSGEKAFEPGLLAKAHGGFLYIDEINLLDDHLVDLLLDVAASGENIVEREGLSVRHPAKFVLVGSGNPEEGELRPQLLDRFGLSVEVRTPTDIETRVTVIKRRAAFDADPAAFVEQWLPETEKIRGTIVAARKRLGGLARTDDVIERAARLCMALGTDGLRGEMTLMRAATALAALDGSETVDARHIDAIAPSVLRHRLRRNPLDEAGSDARIARAIEELASA